LLRLVAGGAAIVQGITKLEASLSAGSIFLEGLEIVAGILLIIGLWTPLSGSLVAAAELWHWISVKPADPISNLLLGAIGAALALVGPGAWSVDSRLFGWKRIEVGRPRK